MASAAKFILYSYARSSCSWRVRTALHHKSLPFEYRPVFIYAGEHNDEIYRQINPAQMVPALVVSSADGTRRTLFESLAIIDYLERTYPKPSIYPQDPIDRTNVVAIAEMIASGIQPLQNMGTMQFAATFAGGSREKALEWSRHWIGLKFARLESILQQMSGKFTVGDHFSLADICLVPQVYNAVHYQVDMRQFPIINRLYGRLLDYESIARARPENQVDFDPEREKSAAGY